MTMTDGDGQANQITELLREWNNYQHGDSAEALLKIVYDELRQQAHRYLRKERAGHTLQTTALVHEAYLKILGQNNVSWKNRAHFFSIAARLMRQILVDHARQHKAEKRGGAAQRFSLEEMDFEPARSAADLLELDAALNKLETIDERKCRVVDMRFFGGMKEAEIAEALGVNEKTVRRDWQFAKLWLYRELSRNDV
mgnify:CR=1 FL=1